MIIGNITYPNKTIIILLYILSFISFFFKVNNKIPDRRDANRVGKKLSTFM